MQNENVPVDQRGWAQFSRCCDIASTALSARRSSILAALREGVIGPEFCRIFVHAFEGAIDVSREDATWTLLTPLLSSPTEINFKDLDDVCPQLSETKYTRDEISTIKLRKLFECFARCFGCAVARSKDIPPEPRVLVSEFERCRQAWESASIEYDVIAPVTGLCPEGVTSIPICDDLSLSWDHRVLWDASRQQLEQFNKRPFESLSPIVLFGRRKIVKSSDLTALWNTCGSDVARCVTAIRLAAGKEFGCEMLHVLPSKAFFQTSNNLRNYVGFMRETRIERYHNPIASTLTDSEAVEAATIAKLLQGEAGKKLNVAVRRCNLAIGRHDLEDELIDLSIALESTLCRQKEHAQLSYRFRLFGAAVVADTYGAEKAFKTLNSLYSIRSAIVHSGRRLDDLVTHDDYKGYFAGRSVQEFVAESRELTRHIILNFLNEAAHGRSPEDYVKSLQDVMVRTAKKVLAEDDASNSTG